MDPVRLGLARSGGQALPPTVRAHMEQVLGGDFSAVRVHVGPQAERIGAVAFTIGNDIYFAPGRYQPDSAQGQQLLGHELAHVIQQRQGRVRAPGAGVSVVQNRALEAEADRMGARAAARRRATRAAAVQRRGLGTGVGARPVVQRMKREREEEGEVSPRTAEGISAKRIELDETGLAIEAFQSSDTFMELLLEHVGIEQIVELMLVNRMYRDRIEPKLVEAITRGMGVSGLSPLVYRGIAKVLARYLPVDTWHRQWALGEGVHIVDQHTEIGNTVARSLAWRGYGRGQANRLGKPVSLERFGRQLLRHLHATVKLRDYAQSVSEDTAYPSQHYYLKASPHDDLVKPVGEYWRNTFGAQTPHPSVADHLARMIANKFELRSGGQNISVVYRGRAGTDDAIRIDYDVYANDPISRDTVRIIQDPVAMQTHFPAVVGKGVKASAYWQVSTGTARFRVVNKIYNARKYGINRSYTSAKTFDIPFHSEVQRFDLSDPWSEDIQRTGNDYCACPQCAAVYQAVGRQDIYQGGTHHRKSPAIIPPKIRENTVFLKEYLGPVAYKRFKALDASMQSDFLDHLERLREDDVTRIQRGLMGPKDSFLWKE